MKTLKDLLSYQISSQQYSIISTVTTLCIRSPEHVTEGLYLLTNISPALQEWVVSIFQTHSEDFAWLLHQYPLRKYKSPGPVTEILMHSLEMDAVVLVNVEPQTLRKTQKFSRRESVPTQAASMMSYKCELGKGYAEATITEYPHHIDTADEINLNGIDHE